MCIFFSFHFPWLLQVFPSSLPVLACLSVVFLTVCLSVCLPACLSISLPYVWLPACQPGSSLSAFLCFLLLYLCSRHCLHMCHSLIPLSPRSSIPTSLIVVLMTVWLLEWYSALFDVACNCYVTYNSYFFFFSFFLLSVFVCLSQQGPVVGQVRMNRNFFKFVISLSLSLSGC